MSLFVRPGALRFALVAACVFASSAPKLRAAETSATAKQPPASATENAKSPRYQLAYKFQSGEVLRYEVRHSTSQRTSIDGTTQESQTRSESVKAWKVTDVLPSGQIEFVHLVEWVKMSNQVSGQPKVSYDSRKDAKPPRNFDQVAAAVGVPLSVVRISPSGVIASREQKHPQPKPTEDMPITLELPKEPIAVGQSWSRTYDLVVDRASGAKQKVRTRRHCRLAEVTAGVAKIEVEYEILTAVEPYVRARLIDRLSRGVVRFDVERGRLVSQRLDVDERIVGFAGVQKASSTHFLSRLEEKLLPPATADGAVTLTSGEK